MPILSLPVGRECLSCLDPMKGIFSYDVRDTCAGCGGKAKGFEKIPIQGGLKAA